MRFIQDCEIIEHDNVAPGHWRMRLHTPEIARVAKPGQFCMVQVAETLSPFLRRPMCFSEIHDDGITILYKVEGEGTALLAQHVPGQKCSIQGPLGNGFPIDDSFERHIIVSGGIGVATFPALAKALVKACPRPPEVVLAARNKDLLLCENLFKGLGCTVYLATDDGSAGEKAYAADMLERLNPGPGTRVYACGPTIMMETTAEVAQRAGADCLVSLEAQMACGDGACLGCVVEMKEKREGDKMVRVCVDGPIFDATLIDWEARNASYDL
jgi:dihydroorotate dehydrogenase electron transfer subunit